jgi:peptidoglycan/xylan/chitin deacetylase (PgdA/CDA1 family)
MFEKLQHNPAIIGKYIFPDIIWESGKKKLILTFDDGPNPGCTENILEFLKVNNLKAVFFCTGSNAAKNPELVRQIHSEGHVIGSHSMHHSNLRELHTAQAEEEITTSTQLLSEIIEEPVRYFRPPFGKFNKNTLRTLKQHQLQCVLWSLLCPDYKNDINLIKFALRFLRNNSIIVLHDNQKSKNIVLQEATMLIEKAKELQFEFGDPLECLK